MTRPGGHQFCSEHVRSLRGRWDPGEVHTEIGDGQSHANITQRSKEHRNEGAIMYVRSAINGRTWNVVRTEQRRDVKEGETDNDRTSAETARSLLLASIFCCFARTQHFQVCYVSGVCILILYIANDVVHFLEPWTRMGQQSPMPTGAISSDSETFWTSSTSPYNVPLFKYADTIWQYDLDH